MLNELTYSHERACIEKALFWIHIDAGKWEDFANLFLTVFSNANFFQIENKSFSTVGSLLSFAAFKFASNHDHKNKIFQNEIKLFPKIPRRYFEILLNRLSTKPDVSYWTIGLSIASTRSEVKNDKVLVQFADTLLYRFRSQLPYQIERFEAEYIAERTHAH